MLGKNLRALDRLAFGKLRSRYADLLERELVGSCESVLDVGCGSDSPLSAFSKQIARTTGVDGYLPSIEKSRAKGIHRDYRQADVLAIEREFGPKSFDAVVALDLIEHFEKENGLDLIRQMTTIAKRKVVIFTPNGFVPQEPYDGNNFQRHISGWSAGEMRALGFRIIGVNGWKPLRGEMADVRFKPTFVWNRVSMATQPFVEKFPSLAYQILCIKDL